MLTHHAIENAGRAAPLFSAQDDYTQRGGRHLAGRGAPKPADGEWTGALSRAPRRAVAGRAPHPDDLQGEHRGEAVTGGTSRSQPEKRIHASLIAGDHAVIEAHNQGGARGGRADGKTSMCAEGVGQKPSRANRESCRRRVSSMNWSRAQRPPAAYARRRDEHDRAQRRAMAGALNEELFRHTKLIRGAYRADSPASCSFLGYEIRLRWLNASICSH